MKKNRMMRLASSLMLAVLLTTSVISGTFAKYVTTDSAQDSARVAKWGVELQVAGNLFGDTYKDVIVAENANDFSVQSVDKTTDLVAPGTENNEGFTYSLKGQPEVDGKVDVHIETRNVFLAKGEWGVMLPVDAGVVTEVNFDEFTDLYYLDGTTYKAATAWDANHSYYTLEDYVKIDNDYYPIIFKSTGGKGTNYDYVTTNTDTMKELVYNTVGSTGAELNTQHDAVKNMTTGITSYDYNKTFEANDDLAEVINLDDMNITWAWAFENQSDGADTILGLLENTLEGEVVKAVEGVYTSTLTEYEDYCIEVLFDIEITATQID